MWTRDLASLPLPTLNELGRDLLSVSSARRVATLGLPFIAMTCYAVFAWLHWWPAAAVAVMALSFVTYGSTSHDLVHRTLGLSSRLNDRLLRLIELLSLRSGTAYRLTHLHHHHHLLADDDIEGACAHGSLWSAIASGPMSQWRLFHWAWLHHPNARPQLLTDAAGIVVLIGLAIGVTAWTLIPLVYAALVVLGSWGFPLVTVYIPHDGQATHPLAQTRLFRGWLVQLVAFHHLYHLEHHLYPAVPHHHWRSLAGRLDAYFHARGVRPVLS